MKNVIYQLHYNFIQDNGAYMEFGAQQEQGLHVNEMSSIQVRMLQSNDIPKLLPATFEQMDMQMKVRYEIGSRKPLADIVKTQGLTEAEYYDLLCGIVTALEDSGKYMLLTEHYLLDEHLIYVGRGAEDVYLTYLPLASIPGKLPAEEEFKQLCLRLIGHVKQFKGYGFQPMMQLLNQDHFRWNELKQLLLRLKYEQPAAVPMAAAQEHAEPMAPLRPIPPQQAANLEAKRPSSAPRREQPSESAAEEARAGALSPMTQREKIYLYAVAVLGAAFSWKWYLDAGTEPAMLVALGLTVLCVNVVYTYTNVYRPDFKKWNKPIGHAIEAKEQQAGHVDVEPQIVKQPAKQPKAKQGKKGKSQPVEQALAAEPAQQLADQTVLLAPAEETVLLGGAGMQSASKEPKAYLEIMKEGVRTEAGIHAERFVIGRDKDHVHYVDDTIGVSRSHVEILLMGSEYMAKDLGSKNGTSLNGEAMVPFKLYLLKEGDVIRTVRSEFTFRMRS